MRTFTPFQIWLETEVANGRTLTSVAKSLGMKPPQLTRIRKGSQSFPKTRLVLGIELTGLTLEELTARASERVTAPEPAPGDPPPPAPRAPVVFDPTPERVHIALQHGLRFGDERRAFCDSVPQGDLDQLWQEWCAKRETLNIPDQAPVSEPIPPRPELYDHLKPNPVRPDFRPAPNTVSAETDHGNYRINIGHKDQ